jgi:coenzyme F420-0:L-glutamate ligase
MPAEFVQVVLEESEKIYGGVPGALLTLKDGQATANAGVDRKNAPGNAVVLWPRDALASAKRLQKELKEGTGKNVGLVIVDSRVTPLRLGTIGVSLASVGFKRVRDFRGKPDLFGRCARITFQAVADGIAGAAQLLMGEARESTPFVLVRGASVEFDGRGGEAETRLSEKDCLYMSQILKPSLETRG